MKCVRYIFYKFIHINQFLIYFLFIAHDVCYNTSIYDTCVYIHHDKNDNENMFVFLIQPSMISYVDVTLNRFKMFTGEEWLVYSSSEKDDLNGLIYKIIKLPNSNYYLTVKILILLLKCKIKLKFLFLKSSPKTASRSNSCMSPKFCQCNNECTDCHDDENKVPIVIQINKLENLLSSNTKCLEEPFQQFRNMSIRMRDF